MIAAFVCLTITEWLRFDRKTRIVHLSLVGWFCGGWFQLVSGERYSTHYFSVIAAPSAMIGAALAGHVSAALPARWRISQTAPAWPLLAVVLSFALSSGTTDRLISAASMTSSFTSVHRAVQLERANQPGPDRSVQAVLDLVSRDRDPLLTYSDDQYLYPDYRRVPATRFQQRYFLIGSIYLGQTGPQYILHNTWTWFADDLRRTNPAKTTQSAAGGAAALHRGAELAGSSPGLGRDDSQRRGHRHGKTESEHAGACAPADGWFDPVLMR